MALVESSSAADALTLQSSPLSQDSYTGLETDQMMTLPAMASTSNSHLPLATPENVQYHPPSFDASTPRHVDHVPSSNVRGRAEEQRQPPDARRSTFGSDNTAAEAANILVQQTVNHDGSNMVDLVPPNIDGQESGLGFDLAQVPYTDSTELIETASASRKPKQGYAMLRFPDGDYIVHDVDIIIGRNVEFWKQVKRQKKQEYRAQRALQLYAQEPSQPSQPGDADQNGQQSSSSQSLEGRPAPPSNFSEHGGAVSYAANSEEDTEALRPKRKRRSHQYSKSSTSNNSVAPASLHANMLDASQVNFFDADDEPEFRTQAYLPIHTHVPEDIFKISKEHAKIKFNFQEQIWELEVYGKYLIVNEQLLERGAIVTLEHDDEIQITSVRMIFKLPDNFRSSPGLSRGTFSKQSDDEDDDVRDSDEGDEDIMKGATRRKSHMDEDDDSDEEDEDEDEEEEEEEEEEEDGQLPVVRRRLKLKVGRRKSMSKAEKWKLKETKHSKGGKTLPKLNLKKQQTIDTQGESSPEATKKPEKGKKPKAAAKEPADAVKVEREASPAEPPQILPGSGLENVRAEELPQKRKGPGRPPKNGIVSKRDIALVKKKEKDYERRGEKPPEWNKMLDEVRRETKQKEQITKLRESGQLPPGMDIVQSIETNIAIGEERTGPNSPTGPQGDSTAAAEQIKRPVSPRPKRTVKSPSPMKPESAYSEEELKKPAATYLVILDEILRDHPTGQADLQEIYDRIQKRYPHFKYRVPSNGWQSSVRHNLLSNARFKENGRSGKGKLWTIDYDVPIEKEKKKKPSPPPPQKLGMHNGQYGSHYGQPMYGNPYGPPPQHGQGPYSSGSYMPYGQAQTPGYGQSGSHNHHRPPQHASPIQQSASATPPVQSGPFIPMVNDIMNFRTVFLKPFVGNQAHMDDQIKVFTTCLDHFSNQFHYGKQANQVEFVQDTEEKKTCYEGLKAIFERHQALRSDAPSAPRPEGNGSNTVQDSSPSQGNAAGPPVLQPQSDAATSAQGPSSQQTAAQLPTSSAPIPAIKSGAVESQINPTVSPAPAPSVAISTPLVASVHSVQGAATASALPAVSGQAPRTAGSEERIVPDAVLAPTVLRVQPVSMTGIKRVAEDDVDGDDTTHKRRNIDSS